jgi:Ca2+-binding RTX toxin-like protein
MGSAGNDTIIGNSTLTDDVIVGGDGNDTLTSGSGADQLGGGVGNDNLSSGAGNDTLFGASGNDILNAGDGTDRINAEGGLDTITTGLGNDTVVYDAAADSSGSLKDIITDFTQSTLNATTGETTAAGDNIEINFGTIGNNVDTWALSDKGDVENGGLAAAAIDGVMGSFVFADDTSTIYLDYNGDGFLNTADLQITVTGLSSFHSNDINAIVVAGSGGDTLTGGSGDDSITGGAGADSLYGGFGNDTIAGAAGGDKIYGQGGNDNLTTASGDSTIDGGAGADTLIAAAADMQVLTGGTGDDIFDLALSAGANNRETISDFEDEGAVVGDIIKLDATDTSDATLEGALPVFATLSTAAEASAAAGIAGTPNSDAFDILEITVSNNASVNMAADFADSGIGTNLLKNIGPANDVTATGITVTGTHKFFIIAYDQGNAYIYAASNAAGNTLLVAAEIIPVATITGITAGGFIADDFLLA